MNLETLEASKKAFLKQIKDPWGLNINVKHHWGINTIGTHEIFDYMKANMHHALFSEFSSATCLGKHNNSSQSMCAHATLLFSSQRSRPGVFLSAWIAVHSPIHPCELDYMEAACQKVKNHTQMIQLIQASSNQKSDQGNSKSSSFEQDFSDLCGRRVKIWQVWIHFAYWCV